MVKNIILSNIYPRCNKLQKKLPQKFEILSKFIIDNYNKFRREPNIINKPLIIGLSGAQGCGMILSFFYIYTSYN